MKECKHREYYDATFYCMRTTGLCTGSDCKHATPYNSKEDEVATLREQLRHAQEREKATIERSNRARLRAVQAEKELDEYRVIALRVEEHAANQQRKREELQDSIDKLCASYNSVSDERDSLKAQMGKAVTLLQERYSMTAEGGCSSCPHYHEKMRHTGTWLCLCRIPR